MELWIVNDFKGVQQGTKDNPYSVATAAEWDTLLASLLFDEQHMFRRGLELHIGNGEFYTAGTYEFGDAAGPNRPRVGPDWKIYGSGETRINLDPTAITDDYIGGWPLRVFTSACTWQQYLWWGREQEWIDLPAEEVWRQLSVGMLVKDLTINLNYSKLISRWQAKGIKFCPSGGLLQGHGPAWENVAVEDFGAWHPVDDAGKLAGPPAEAFPLSLAGAVDIFDRNKIAKLDPSKYIFDSQLPKEKAAHHTGCRFDKYNEVTSNDQVSLCVISGSIGQKDAPAVGDYEQSKFEYSHTLRAWAYQTNNPMSDFSYTRADRNQLQGFTIYQTLGGEVAHNGGSNMNAAYYSDFFVSSNIDVHDNDWKRVLRGAAWFLSPVGPDVEHFTSRGHKFRNNKVTLLPVPNGAEWNGAVMLQNFGERAPWRFIGDFTVEGNYVRLAEGPGQGYAINAVKIDGLTIGKNDFGNLAVVTRDCTGVSKPLSWWQKILKFLHIIK